MDDGASDSSQSVAMAKLMVAQGVTAIACTPHILPGLYHNTGPAIRQATRELQQELERAGIPLRLETGADVHMTPNMIDGLRSGQILSIADSRYVLVEPPQHSAPPQLESFFFNLVVAGYVPILTHPERLPWLSSRYQIIERLVRAGVWMQLTASSLAGGFGRGALYCAERMLEDGYVHLIASDAHDVERRPPDLAAGRDLAARRVGADEAERLVLTRPMGILKDQSPSSLSGPLGVADAKTMSSAAAADRIGRSSHVQVARRAGYDGLRGWSGRLRHFFR
jgi:protein-tyrosine phosphatase